MAQHLGKLTESEKIALNYIVQEWEDARERRDLGDMARFQIIVKELGHSSAQTLRILHNLRVMHLAAELPGYLWAPTPRGVEKWATLKGYDVSASDD